MIRVGFVFLNHDQDWLGGINYYRSLLSAIELLPNRCIEPVVFISNSAPEAFVRNFKNVEVVRTNLDYSVLPVKLICKGLKKLCSDRDYLLYRLLLRNRIDVMSHSGFFWSGCKIKTIVWIPDFQHIHCPEFFSTSDQQKRNDVFSKLIKNSDSVIVSSKTAYTDLINFSPAEKNKGHVLRFVPEIKFFSELNSKEAILGKYNFKLPYFFLPNQYWKHKNHDLVIEALAILKKRGVGLTVISTGSFSDYRNPHHYDFIVNKINSLNLKNDYIILGVVPYEDLLTLMRHAIAVINPSFFEGWSTTVEEAKIINGSLLLSDIPVHREQAPKNGLYFDPNNPDDLANLMFDIVSGYCESQPNSPINEILYVESRLMFAQNYQEIVKSIF